MRNNKRRQVSEVREEEYVQVIVEYKPELIETICNVGKRRGCETYYKGKLISNGEMSKDARNFLKNIGYTFKVISKPTFPFKKELFGVPVTISGSLNKRKYDPEDITIVIRADNNIEENSEYYLSFYTDLGTVKGGLRNLGFNVREDIMTKKQLCRIDTEE